MSDRHFQTLFIIIYPHQRAGIALKNIVKTKQNIYKNKNEKIIFKVNTEKHKNLLIKEKQDKYP